ncbi:MAG TPA: hypothetical protein VLE93_00595 [Candidatus Saccharimonadales bacterium]|nr:hypothetical protein [Candidatus Saccharimonadales bacterium]
MVKIVLIIVAVLVVIFLLVLLGFELRTMQVERDARQKQFAAGSLPSPLPDGFYTGVVNNYKGGWTGKTFDLAAQTGINNFKDGNKLYPFKFYTGPGVRDKKIQTLKIDYNQPANSWWIRHIVDEVVQTSPNHFLGKIHVRWAGLTFTIGYFTLAR